MLPFSRASTAICPGPPTGHRTGQHPSRRPPWEEVAKHYAFVDEMEKLAARVEGAGNRARFAYWQNIFQTLRAIARVNCAWSRFNKAIEPVKAKKILSSRKGCSRHRFAVLRVDLVAACADMHRFCYKPSTQPGEMGNVANWQTQSMPVVLTRPGEELLNCLENAPARAQPSMQ